VEIGESFQENPKCQPVKDKLRNSGATFRETESWKAFLKFRFTSDITKKASQLEKVPFENKTFGDFWANEKSPRKHSL